MREKITNWIKDNHGLLLAIVLYFILIFYNFFKQGLINWDEAYFMVVINTFTDILKTAFTHPANLISGNYYQELMANYGNIYTAARPAYVLPAVLINTIFTSEFSSRLLSVFSGFLSIIFFYKILVFYNFKKIVRVASAFLLAASPLFLIYSRLGLSQILSAALLLIAIYYLLKFNEQNKKKDLKISAIFLSLLIMSHYNTIFLVVFLFLYTLFVLYKKRAGIKNYFIYLCYLLLIPVVWEIITRIGLWIAHKREIKTGIFSYFQEFAEQLGRAGSNKGFVIDQVLYYPKLFISTEGIIFAILFLIGLLIFFKNIKKIKYNLVLIPPLMHLAIFSIVSLKFPRNIITVLPAMYIFSALGLNLIYRLSGRKVVKNTLLATLVILAIIFHANQYKNFLNIKTNFHNITDFIKTNYTKEEIVILSSSAPVWRNYLPGYRTESIREEGVWQEYLGEKKLLFISDYFTATLLEEEKYLSKYSKKNIEKYETNIFLAKPIILDFVYQSEEENKKMFEKNKSKEIILYEITNK